MLQERRVPRVETAFKRCRTSSTCDDRLEDLLEGRGICAVDLLEQGGHLFDLGRGELLVDALEIDAARLPVVELDEWCRIEAGNQLFGGAFTENVVDLVSPLDDDGLYGIDDAPGHLSGNGETADQFMDSWSWPSREGREGSRKGESGVYVCVHDMIGYLVKVTETPPMPFSKPEIDI